MPAVDITERAPAGFQHNVDMKARRKRINCPVKPKQSAAQLEVDHQAALIEAHYEIFAVPADAKDASAFNAPAESGGRLGTHGDSMADVNAADLFALDIGAKGPRHSFHFRRFWHSVFSRKTQGLKSNGSIP